MISDRSKYRFVTPPDWMEINGGILPARDVADDGSSSVLRGEDACFLTEAARRAFAYRRYGTPFNSLDENAVGEEISTNPVGGAIHDIVEYPSHSYNSVKYAIPGSPSFAGSYVKDVGSGDIIAGVLSGGMYIFAPSAPSGGLQGILDSDAIRRAYYDLRQSGCFVFDGDLGGAYLNTPSRVFRVYDYDAEHGWTMSSESVTQDTGGGVVGFNKSTYELGKGYYRVNDWTMTNVVPTGTGTSVPTPISRLYGADVQCHAVFAVSVYHKAGANASGVWYNDAIVMDAEISSDGTVYIGSLTADQVKTAVGGARNIPTTWGDVPNGADVSISVSPRALVFRDNEIDTSSIDWGWEPPSSQAQ